MHSYGLRGYGTMMADRRRVNAYVEALRRTVRPGSVVVDIGTGTGVLAMAACQFGAKRVYAIEPNEVVQLAREIAADNGWADRIEFIQELSTQVSLPSRADVIVADVHGVLPLFESSVATLIDARDRMLAPGGAMIPFAESIHAAIVEDPQLYGRLVGPWTDGPAGLNMRRGARHMTSEMHRAEFGAAQLLTPPAVWKTLDYRSIDRADVCGSVSLVASREGSAHGLALWFEAKLAEDVGFSTAPGEPAMVFGHAFVAWPEPIALRAGDAVDVRITANPLHGLYLWRWHTTVKSANTQVAAFEQSQFEAGYLTPGMLRRHAASNAPALNSDGEACRMVLDRLAEGRTIGDIAREVQAINPQRFRDWHEALDWVGELALRFGD